MIIFWKILFRAKRKYCDSFFIIKKRFHVNLIKKRNFFSKFREKANY